jgi:hypothetical protein
MADSTSSAMLGQAQGLNKNVSDLVSIMRSAFSPMNVHQGQFICSAAATTTVADTNVKATSFITLAPQNAAGASLMAGSHSLYVSAKAAGTSFTAATADGGAAAGSEIVSYLIINAG